MQRLPAEEMPVEEHLLSARIFVLQGFSGLFHVEPFVAELVKDSVAFARIIARHVSGRFMFPWGYNGAAGGGDL